MKKILKSTLSLALVCMILASLVLPAYAATITKATHTSSTYGQNVTVFYVNAKNKNTTKVNYSCTQGSFQTNKGSLKFLYGRNSTSESWTQISKTNIKNVSSTTLSMKGYTQYKVRVYSWNTITIGNYRGGEYKSSSASWWTTPTCTFTAKSNVSSLAK